MSSIDLVDTMFDVRTDAGGKDPDSHSKTLRRYHQLLWSKELPSGARFDLDLKLHHESDLGEFWLSSDSIIHTYSTWGRPRRMADVVQQISPEEAKDFYDAACTVGAYIVFPMQTHVDGAWRRSINQSRGTSAKIRDRFDLTLECIRRHYLGERSPLKDTFAWYESFFDLFGDFVGYVDYFLLRDLLGRDQKSIEFFLPFDGFDGDALPAASTAEYREYMRRSMNFVSARNHRISAYVPDLQS